MGQTASNQRGLGPSNDQNIHPSARRPRRATEPPARSDNSSQSSSLLSTTDLSTPRSPHLRNPSTRLLATFTRQTSASSMGVVRGETSQNLTPGSSNTLLYERQEERPLVHMGDLGMRNAPITHITASPMPRRFGLSRLSSVILRRDSDNERDLQVADQQIHWRRPFRRESSEIAREGQRQRIRRSELHGATSPQPLVGSDTRRRRSFAPIFRSNSLRADSPMPSSFVAHSSQGTSSGREFIEDSRDPRQSNDILNAPLSRLARIRRSLSSPIDIASFIRQSPSQDASANPQPQPSTRSSLPVDSVISQTSWGAATANELSRISSNLDDDIGQQVEHIGLGNPPDSSDIEALAGRTYDRVNRLAEGPQGGRRENRRVSSILSGRSTRPLRRDRDGPLPRILNLAAFALAARLAGPNVHPANEMQGISGSDPLDGNLQNLFRALQNTAHLTPGEFASTETEQELDRSTGPNNPLRYLRVFRFVSIAAGAAVEAELSAPGQSDSSTRSPEQHAAVERESEDSAGRTVTLVVIGVRSIPLEETTREPSSVSEPVEDTLLDVPSLGPVPAQMTAELEDFPTSENGRSRHHNSRRVSSDGVTSFPAENEDQRNLRSRSLHISQGPLNSESAIPTGTPIHSNADSPPGPRPPPSTPAEPISSAISSEMATLSIRPSSSSIIQPTQLPTHDTVISSSREETHPISRRQDQPTRPFQHRRRSESEFSRHMNLGAGAARRNGVVAPDEADSPAPDTARSRSWLIYVVGTNIAEDHPALTTPSLFTDNPSYEDMLLLSSLLGPVRPPVATPENVSSAGGLFRVSNSTVSRVADGTRRDATLHIDPGERCLICLDEYQMHEEVRQLRKCSHVFHQVCIDEWLTTGRNSCPLCREEGVPVEKIGGEESQTTA